MDQKYDIKSVLEHLINGDFESFFCRMCLQPLCDTAIDVEMVISKDNFQFCISEVFEKVLQIKFTESKYHKVCQDCFITASTAYKFYLVSHKTQEILEFYLNQLYLKVNNVSNGVSVIVLPKFKSDTPEFNIDLPKKKKEELEEINLIEELTYVNTYLENSDRKIIDDNLNYKAIDLDQSKNSKNKRNSSLLDNDFACNKNKKSRTRSSMEYRECTLCPVKYRQLSKLKEHLKQCHNVDVFVCTICKTINYSKNEHKMHLQSHSSLLTCHICNMTCKREKTLRLHLQKHQQLNNLAKEGIAYICDACGEILPNQKYLNAHIDKKHTKKYTCYYCGKMYKGLLSYQTHIGKHKAQMKSNQTLRNKGSAVTNEKNNPATNKSKSFLCSMCNKNFVDQRSLMWHERLHKNERPYECRECGKRFVSDGRRAQHALTAHAAPTRRCPLCPALFHLNSMVNSHVKKVHLTDHKRRRTKKHREVYWKTETVPVKDLSMSIQKDILNALESKNMNKESVLS